MTTTTKNGRPKKEEAQIKAMIVLPKEMTDKIDVYTKNYGVSRNAFIKMAIAEKLIALERNLNLSSEK